MPTPVGDGHNLPGADVCDLRDDAAVTHLLVALSDVLESRIGLLEVFGLDADGQGDRRR